MWGVCLWCVGGVCYVVCAWYGVCMVCALCVYVWFVRGAWCVFLCVCGVCMVCVVCGVYLWRVCVCGVCVCVVCVWCVFVVCGVCVCVWCVWCMFVACVCGVIYRTSAGVTNDIECGRYKIYTTVSENNFIFVIIRRDKIYFGKMMLHYTTNY